MRYRSTLRKVIMQAIKYGFIIKSAKFRFYKGDLDGQTIWIDESLNKQKQLFNILHLFGHSVQWSVNEELRELGNVLHKNPNDELLLRLQNYEWEANCYALQLLHNVGVTDMDEWLSDMFKKDMFYLTHFYKTGEKLKHISATAMMHTFTKPLVALPIPEFVVRANEINRNGIVI